jgi:hypothetical protein
MDKIENQVNVIEDLVYNRAHKQDITALEKRLVDNEGELANQIANIKNVAQGAEQLANRMVDDALAGQEELMKQIQTHEFRISEIYSYIAESEEESQLATSKRLKNSTRTPKKDLKVSGFGMLPNIEKQLESLEERITRRMAESVESLGDIITDQAKKLDHLFDRVMKLEKIRSKSPMGVAGPYSNLSNLKNPYHSRMPVGGRSPALGSKKSGLKQSTKKESLISSKNSRVGTARSSLRKKKNDSPVRHPFQSGHLRSSFENLLS